MKSLLEEKKQRLQRQLEKYCENDVCVAFSGGVDSSLLLAVACEAAEQQGSSVYAITMDTVLHPKSDLETAKQVLSGLKAEHVLLTMDELAVPEIRNNPKNRCYLCKKELYGKMLQFAEAKNISCLLEGSNEDDLHVYRPGLQAIRELGVKSPLADCMLTKKEVRELAAEYHIPVAERPSSPCLATRLPYGAQLDLELLARIENAEQFLKEKGFYNVRARVHDDILRLELDLEQFSMLYQEKEKVIAKMKSLGFRYITLDLEGFRSGSMDQQILLW